MDNIAVITGVGPGLGAALVRRFTRAGFGVAGLARKATAMTALAESVVDMDGHLLLIDSDATDQASVGDAMTRIRSELGTPNVWIYNAGAIEIAGILDVSPEQFEKTWKTNCFGAFLGAREVLPAMVEAGSGTILLTSATAAWRGSANFSCLAVGKFGLRALAQSMAREFGPRGIHVATVVVDGLIDTPRVRERFGSDNPMLDPDAIAETYWQLHCQNRRAWTLELDLRPADEKF